MLLRIGVVDTNLIIQGLIDGLEVFGVNGSVRLRFGFRFGERLRFDCCSELLAMDVDLGNRGLIGTWVVDDTGFDWVSLRL